ncbi:MAG TPA: hypothetical protein EYG38_21955 [Verrucomicrobia bacterium]|nr:hypothetical protein [Verrucomicrobiota bacterium]
MKIPIHWFCPSLSLRYGCFLVTFIVLSITTHAKDLAPYEFDHFFDPSRLVKMDIEIDQADWDKLRMQHRSLLKTLRTDIPATEQESQFDYFPANLTIDGTDLGKVAIRKKGFVGSMDQQRPSFKIQIDKFDKKKSFAGIDTLTLNNNKQDPSRVNQVIGYQVFRLAGLPASHCNLAVVTVNGKPLGVYSNVESPDKRFIRRNFGNDDGALFEGTIADFDEDSLIRFDRKFGKKKLEMKLTEVLEALKTTDDTLIEELGKIVDLDNFYSYWALECLLGHWDGYVSNKNNYFVYHAPATDRIQFMPWGIDQLGEDNNIFWGRGFKPPKSVKADGAIARRLYQIKEGQDSYFAALRELLDTVWKEDEWVARIERLEEMIEPHRGSVGRNRRQTGIDLKKFISGRRAQVEAEMKEGYPEWTLALRPGMNRIEKRGDCEIKFSFKMADLKSGRNSYVASEVEAEFKVLIDGNEIEFHSEKMAIRQNRGWGGGSLSLQFTRPSAAEGTPSTIEVTFPKRMHPTGDPYRIDVFASPASGRLLNGSGNVGEDGTRGALTGTLELTAFGDTAGDQISGRLKGEFFAFIPKDTAKE